MISARIDVSAWSDSVLPQLDLDHHLENIRVFLLWYVGGLLDVLCGGRVGRKTGQSKRECLTWSCVDFRRWDTTALRSSGSPVKASSSAVGEKSGISSVAVRPTHPVRMSQAP